MNGFWTILLFAVFLKTHVTARGRSERPSAFAEMGEPMRTTVYNFRPPSDFTKSKESEPTEPKESQDDEREERYRENNLWDSVETIPRAGGSFQSTEHHHSQLPPLPPAMPVPTTRTRSQRPPPSSRSKRPPPILRSQRPAQMPRSQRPHYKHKTSDDSYQKESAQESDSTEDNWTPRPKHKPKHWRHPNFKPEAPILPTPGTEKPDDAWNYVHHHTQQEKDETEAGEKVTTMWSVGPYGGFVMTEEFGKPISTPDPDLLIWRPSTGHRGRDTNKVLQKPPTFMHPKTSRPSSRTTTHPPSHKRVSSPNHQRRDNPKKKNPPVPAPPPPLVGQTKGNEKVSKEDEGFKVWVMGQPNGKKPEGSKARKGMTIIRVHQNSGESTEWANKIMKMLEAMSRSSKN